jgi:hypothetical protein
MPDWRSEFTKTKDPEEEKKKEEQLRRERLERGKDAKEEIILSDFMVSKIPEIRRYVNNCRGCVSSLGNELFSDLPEIKSTLESLEEYWERVNTLVDFSKLPNLYHHKEVTAEIKKLRDLLSDYESIKPMFKLAALSALAVGSTCAVLCGTGFYLREMPRVAPYVAEYTTNVIRYSILWGIAGGAGGGIVGSMIGVPIGYIKRKSNRTRMSGLHIEPIKNLSQYFTLFENEFNSYLDRYGHPERSQTAPTEINLYAERQL